MYKNLLRILLVISLYFYLPLGFSGARIFSFWGKTMKPKIIKTESGIGGMAAERIQVEFDSEIDLELEGIPEPEEFSKPLMLTFGSYTLEQGDMIGKIAIWAGLNEDTLISVNNIKNTRLMQIGQVIRIPNQDGIYYEVKSEDTLESIAEKYKTTVSHIKTANELFSDSLSLNEKLFIPGAKLDWINRQEINGDLFIWPCSGYVSSPYGYRMAPFARSWQFHTGIDISSIQGSPVRAAMAGRVTHVGYDDSWGNNVVINHHSGYRTFYGHMDVVRVKAGAYVETGERIGDIGSTGLSTGPHLHFSVYKNGVTVNPRSLIR
ncbi:MAG: M23 family metallopeptidase [Treponema sp.]|jgi:murein DD-endopeptidase MepM/ murein hydrolase activator NlpD|nr:M23 family metallopeptidase [Treponema sp.]